MEVKPVKIFADGNIPRLRYIADLLLHEILGLSWEIVTDKRKIGKNPVINYSDDNIPGSLKISPAPLLHDTGVKAQEIRVNEWNSLPVFFQTSPDSDLPFDVFAASFYLVTRYEEYLDFIPDEFGRFKGSGSLAFINGFLGIPVIDLWARELAIALVRKYQTLAFKRNIYRALLTVDVDEPYAYLGKGLIGSIGGFIHDLASKTGQATQRFDTIAKGEKDPYEVFDYILEIIHRNGTETNFFIPVGNQSGYDKNPSWKNDEYKRLIIRIAEKYKVGLHPSFKASGGSPVLGTELKRLESILKKEIICSRFHFLKIVMPKSYRNLSSAGITEDFSMGYQDEPGFRAGIARPFIFYDVSEDRTTNLRIFPFQAMDVTLTSYKKMKPDAAKETISNMISQTRKVGGLFVSIWHNTTLLDTPECREWRDVFEFTLKEQIN
jgi:hypothetical protein